MAMIKTPPKRLFNYVIIILGVLLTIFFITREYQMQNEAEYDIHFGSVKGHFIDLGQGYFLDEHGEGVAGIMPSSYGGHDLGRGRQASGFGTAPIPSQLYLFWYSLTDDKFYDGTFKLPPKEELAYALNKQRVIDVFDTRRGQMTKVYDGFTVNVAPNGNVHVYLKGHMVKLIGSYKAKPVDYSWEDWVTKSSFHYYENDYSELNESLDNEPPVHKNREKVIAERYDHYSMLVPELPSSYNEGYFDPVQITLHVEGAPVGKLVDYKIYTLNGEYQDILENPEDHIITSIPTGALIDLELNGVLTRYSIDLSSSTYETPTKKELYEFYQNNFDPKQKVKLILDVPNEDEFFIYFQQGDKRVEFEGAYAEIRDL